MTLALFLLCCVFSFVFIVVLVYVTDWFLIAMGYPPVFARQERYAPPLVGLEFPEIIKDS